MFDLPRENDKPTPSSALAKAGEDLSRPDVNGLRRSVIDSRMSIHYGMGPLDGDNPPTVGPVTDSRRQGKAVVPPAAPPRDNATGLRTPPSFSDLVNQGLVGKSPSPSDSPSSVNRPADAKQAVPNRATAKDARQVMPRAATTKEAPLAIPKKEIIINLTNRRKTGKPNGSEKSSDIDKILEIHGSVKNDRNFIAHARAEIGKLPPPILDSLKQQGVKILVGESMDALAADGTLAKYGININEKAGGNIKADGSPMSVRYLDGTYDIKSKTVILTRDVAMDVPVWNPRTRRNETRVTHINADHAFRVTNHLSNIMGHEVSHALDHTDPKGSLSSNPAIIAAHAADVKRLTPADRTDPSAYQYIVQDENPESGRIEAVGYIMPTVLMNKDISGRWTKGELQTKFPNTYRTIANLVRTRQYGRDLAPNTGSRGTYRLRK